MTGSSKGSDTSADKSSGKSHAANADGCSEDTKGTTKEKRGDVAKDVPTQASKVDTDHQKVTICHATGSKSNPFVLISVDAHAVELPGHRRHATEGVGGLGHKDVIGATSLEDCVKAAPETVTIATREKPTLTNEQTSQQTNELQTNQQINQQSNPSQTNQQTDQSEASQQTSLMDPSATLGQSETRPLPSAANQNDAPVGQPAQANR